MVRSGKYAECRRSYLGEAFPFPELPSTAVYQGDKVMSGVACEHWLEDVGESRVHIYVNKANGGMSC